MSAKDIVLRDDRTYVHLSPNTPFKELQRGDRFIYHGITYSVRTVDLNHTGKKVIVGIGVVHTPHPRHNRWYSQAGELVVWSVLRKTPVNRVIYRPTQWQPSDDPEFFDYIIEPDLVTL